MSKSKTYWETIDYIGSGYVLQRKKRAQLNKDGTAITETTDVFGTEKETTTVSKTTHDPNNLNNLIQKDVDIEKIQSVTAKERVIHISKVDGIDTSSLKEDIGNATLK